MADSKISELTALTSANSADNDLIAVVDTGAIETKSMTLAELDNRALSGIADQTAATVAAGDLLVINDINDSNLPKQVTATSVAALASHQAPTWTDYTPTTGGLDTGTLTLDYARYYLFGKIMFIQWSYTQLTTGSGAGKFTITPPAGVTLVDCNNAGSVSTLDSSNNNIYQSMNAECDNSTNVFWIRRTDTALYILGGAFIGNNGVVQYAFNGVVAIE